MIGSVLGKLGLPVLLSVVSDALSRINHPAAKKAAESVAQVEEAINMGTISPEQAAEANRHIETMTQIESETSAKILAEVNASLRAEVISEDKFVRRMRPTFGYLMAITWTAQMLAIAYVIIFETEQASLVIEATQSLGTIWTVGLSVLGIYVYKRSEEKRTYMR